MRARFAGIAIVALGAVAAALVSQHAYNMQPCPWCVLQRLIFVAIAAWAIVGWMGAGFTRSRVWRGLIAAVLALLALAGAAAALWQHFVAARAASCDMSFADRFIGQTGLDSLLPEVFMATASCAEAKVDLFGLPYEFWSLALFGLMALVLIKALVSR